MSEGSFFYRQNFIFTHHFVIEAPLVDAQDVVVDPLFSALRVAFFKLL